MFKQRRECGVSIHGNGAIGGKGEGLLLLGGMGLKSAKLVGTDILCDDFYKRFMDNGGTFDREMRKYLEGIHATLDGHRICVRPSENGENNPKIATSGTNTSFPLPNNNPEAEKRVSQFLRAIEHGFIQYAKRSGTSDPDGVAIVINPINGRLDHTPSGDFFYPMSSGVADSFFNYPVANKKAEEGFARVAFGHGYATVRDDFEVIPVLTIGNPEKPSSISRGQRFFYAIDMSKNHVLSGDEMETMAMLTITHANPEVLKHFTSGRYIEFDRLLGEDHLGYASGLRRIMEEIEAGSGNQFQIEFTFNIFDGAGVFHVVQYKEMPRCNLERIDIPDDGRQEYIATDRVQGNGVKENIECAIVISPFNYRSSLHSEVKGRLKEMNMMLNEDGKRFILVCPGRVGTTNLEWGINVDFPDISGAKVIVEYGYDITGRPDIPFSHQEKTGGIFGSHFLYQMLGGASEDERIRQLRMLGSQGTHFITNLITTGAIYLHVDPNTGTFDPWFFDPPAGEEASPIYMKTFDSPMTVYADRIGKRCVIK